MSVTESPTKCSGVVDEAQTSALTTGIMSMFEPIVIQLDDQVAKTRQSQANLRDAIETLSQDLHAIAASHDAPPSLQSSVLKLNESRKRVAVVASILGNAHERLAKLQRSIARETSRRSSLLDPQLPPNPTTQGQRP